MPECHKCEHNQSKAIKRLPYEKTPCYKCNPTADLSNYGRTFVSMDTDAPAVQNIELKTDQADAFGATQFSREDLKAGLNTLLQLLMCNPVTAKIVIYRICRPTEPLHKIAFALGISTQAAHSRLQKAVRKWTELKAVIPIKQYNTKGK